MLYLATRHVRPCADRYGRTRRGPLRWRDNLDGIAVYQAAPLQSRDLPQAFEAAFARPLQVPARRPNCSAVWPMRVVLCRS